MPDFPLPPNGAPQVAYEEAVDPDGPGATPCADPLGAFRVAGDHRRGQPEPGLVGERDRLVLGAEGLQREDRPEDLLGEDLAARLGADEQRRPVVEAAEVVVRAAARGPPRAPSAIARRTKPSTRSRCARLTSGPMSVASSRGSPCRIVAALARKRARELVGDRLLDQERVRRTGRPGPELSYCSTARSTARSRSASAKTSSGDLPPSSKDSGVEVGRRGRGDARRRSGPSR